MNNENPYPVLTPVHAPSGALAVPDRFIARKSGDFVVSRHADDFTYAYEVWSPQNCPRPKDDNDSNAKLARLYMLEIDGYFYSRADPDFMSFWARSHPHPMTDIEKQTAQEWGDLEYRRHIIMICRAFPEAKDGWRNYGGGITLPIPGKNTLDTGDLDDLEKAGRSFDPYIGWKIKHEMLGTGELVKLPPVPDKDADKIAVRWRVQCCEATCRHRVTIYTVSGCHHGAFCYVTDPKTRQHVADLRNQSVRCDSCCKKSKRR